MVLRWWANDAIISRTVTEVLLDQEILQRLLLLLKNSKHSKEPEF
jgi:hypothetical protein